jgi:nucleoside-diphosphate-sugar epimerase
MNIFITGGAGFIGSMLTDKLLASGNTIICLDNFDNFYSRDKKESNLNEARKSTSFTFIEGDIRDSDLLNRIFSEKKIDIVIHLAAKAGESTF